MQCPSLAMVISRFIFLRQKKNEGDVTSTDSTRLKSILIPIDFENAS